MDNTPTHQTQYFSLLSLQDTSIYSNHPGVDHFYGQQVCLKYYSIDTTQSHNEGLVNIIGNTVISINNGEFSDLNGNPYFFSILFGFNHKPCLWYDLKNKNPFDPDTLKVKSFWGEPLDMGIMNGISYHKLTQRDVFMHPAAVQLLGSHSLKTYSDLNIPRPYTWIHPSGQMPWINAYEIKSFLGDSLNYTAASNYTNAAFFCYNEYNPSGTKQFSLQSGDISIENHDLTWNKSEIVNSFAKHYIKVDLSYFIDSPPGGWNGYLSRVDSLLNWCVASNIPVLTYHQWTAMLYDSIPNRVTNIFPKLNTDLDGNNFPDGYDQNSSSLGIYSLSDGVEVSGNRCFMIGGSGNICQITALAGLEKGDNKFSIWVKRSSNDTSKVLVNFYFPETGGNYNMEFSVDSIAWVKKFQILNVPENASIVNILIANDGLNNDTVKISGMDLRSSGFLKTTHLPDQVITANEPFQSIDLNTLVIDSITPGTPVIWTISGGSTLNLSITPENLLDVQKPKSFWIGTDSVYLVAQDLEGIKDSCFVKFISNKIPTLCKGNPLMLSLLDTLDNDIIQWNSVPYDSTISNPGIFNPIVNPTKTTWYKVICINPLGNVNKDSVQVIRYPDPDPGLPPDTTICWGDSIRLTAIGGDHYLWNTGDTVASIVVKPVVTTQYSVFVTNQYNCYASDSLIITVNSLPIVTLSGLLPAYCSDDEPVNLNGQPLGGFFHATSGLVNKQFFPSIANIGLNNVWYTFTDETGCSNADTITTKVNPLPAVFAQPDTTLCVENSIILHAGPGFDNYQWSNGATDSITIVDSVGRGIGFFPIWVYVTKNGCANMDTAYVNFIACTGIQENNAFNPFRVFPNPADQEICISDLSYHEKETVTVNILDLNGKVIRHLKLCEPLYTIRVADFLPGCYFINIIKGKQRFDFQFIKK
ncbi:MAG: T9SS type A sorting domain-containing protein [Bacteroidales bacterium]|nr:T9SS type A sorting domain-containing protein [Bacteroidales bacterium]